jgi:Haem-NO-binding
MYGMVNQAVKDLVVTKFGPESWGKICEKANISTEDFVFMQYYPDKLTYDLVGAASALLGVSGEVVLKEFGKHWVLYTAKEGYGPIMDLFGADFKSCLQNLNNLHARMGMTMPSLTPPSFSFYEENEKTYVVSYFSKRAGLSPMVTGILEGLAEKYKIKIQVDYSDTRNGKPEHNFKVTVLG